MKCVVSGRMADAARIEEVPIKNGENKGQRVTMATFTLFAPDPNGPKVTRKDADGKEVEYTKGIPLNCKAWGENAEHIKGLEKGDTVTGAATVRYGGNNPMFVVTRIDPDNQIQKQMSNLITAYSNGEINQVFENEAEREPLFRSNDVEKAKDMQQSSQMIPDRERDQEMVME